MILPRNSIQRRGLEGVTAAWVGVVSGLVAIFILLGLVNVLRKRRIRNRSPPAWIPGTYLRRKWDNWQPSGNYVGVNRGGSRPRQTPSSTTHRPSTEIPTSSARDSRTESDFADNRQSVRSIMTLPAYNPAPLPSERLIAREGERAGVDTVVEYPESETEVEARREEEMDTLYSIREARRREQREREERRQARRRARGRGDWVQLEQLEAESRARARARATSNATSGSGEHSRRPSDTSSLTPGTRTERSQQDSSLLIAELNSLRDHHSRTRRVSSVSYADLGVARHDGSRIRGESIDSDHRPLLDSAASMGGSRQSRSRAASGASTRDNSRSRSRAASFRTDPYDGSRRPSIGGSTVDEDGRDFLTPQSSGDLPPEPPSYEDDLSVHGAEGENEAPPDYSSPVLERNPQFPAPAHVSTTSPNHSRNNSAARTADPRASQDTLQPSTGDGFESALTRLSTSELPPLILQLTTESTPPSIEVSSATPISSLPPTPQHSRFPRAL